MPPPLTITVKETFTDRSMEYSVGGVRDYVRQFLATSNVVTDMQAILLAAGVPRLGDFYVTAQGGIDVAATCRRVRATQRHESPREWLVEVSYSSRWERSAGGSSGGASDTGGSPQEAGVDNPLLLPTKIQPGTKKYQRPVEFDVLPNPNNPAFFGNPVVTTAGRKFDPPLMEEVCAHTLTLTRNLATLDFVAFANLQNKINASNYLGFLPKTLKVDTLEATWTYESGVYFWAVKAVLEKAPNNETWVRQVLNAGFEEFVNGKIRPIRFADGSRPSVPWPLDATGAMLPEDGTGTPIYVSVQTLQTIDFALLGFFG